MAKTNVAENQDPNNLKLGDSGDKVKALQTWLTDYGYYTGAIDGNFGAATEEAVKQFQIEASIQVDGKVGNQTQTAMAKWDQFLAKVEAAAGNSKTSNSISKNTYTAKKAYFKSYAGQSAIIEVEKEWVIAGLIVLLYTASYQDQARKRE
jgi:cell wall hydrolase